MAITDLLFGKHLASDEEGEHRVGTLAGIPMLGLDALGSAAFGPEVPFLEHYPQPRSRSENRAVLACFVSAD